MNSIGLHFVFSFANNRNDITIRMATSKTDKSENNADEAPEQSNIVTSKFTAADRKQAEQSSTLSVYNSSAEASVRLSDSTSSEQHTPLDPSTTPTTSKATLNIQHGSDYDDTPFQDEFSLQKDINVKFTADRKDGFIVAMTLLSENELALCDRYNKSVKVLNIDNDVICSNITFGTPPADITSLPGGKVAVVSEDEQAMRILSKCDGSLKEIKLIRLTGEPVSVECLKDEIFVSFKEPLKLNIFSLSGGIRRTIIPDSKCLENIHLPGYIAVHFTDTTSIIYISDYRSNTIVSIDLNGTMLAMYKDEGLVRPYDITITPFGSIYVCNSYNHIIYKMSEDLTEGEVILDGRDGLIGPCAMCFCPGRKSLYISSRDTSNLNFLQQYTYN